MKFIKRFLFEKKVKSFISHKINNIQFDVYNRENEIIVQVFKGYDVKNWEIDITDCDNCSVVQLLFHPHKTNNLKNRRNFLTSNLVNRFDKIDFYDQETYFCTIKNNNELSKLIKEIISSVYDLSIYNTKSRLNLFTPLPSDN